MAIRALGVRARRGATVATAIVAVMTTVGGSGVAVPTSPAEAATPATGSRAFAAGETRELSVTGRAGVPVDGVGAVVLNLTATNTTASTHVVAWPSGQPMPATSNLNAEPGEDRANLAIVPVGTDGRVTLANHAGRTDLVVDLVGWLPDDGGYTPAGPQRLLDTRASRPLTGGGVVDVALGPSVPASALAVVNLTGVGASTASHLVAWPAGSVMPPTSNLNIAPGGAVANLALVSPGYGGAITVSNHAGTTDVIVDLLGWFAPGRGITALAPTRLADTRVTGSALGPAATVAVSTTGLPVTGAGTAVMTLTGLPRTRSSYVTAWSAGSARPATSNLNLVPGRAMANLALVHIDQPQVQLFNSAGTADLVVDALAWAPDGGPLTPIAPTRLMDTRAAPTDAEVPPVVRARRAITYSVSTSGAVTAALTEFTTQVAETLADARGWPRAGLAFEQVASGGEFTIWLAAAAKVPSFGSPCTVNYSCRVGRNVVINEDRWKGASAAWNAAGAGLRDYRHMVVNHEVGHWLGHGHHFCSAPGAAAPVMQQQSKDLAGCQPNPWPLDGELIGVGAPA